MLIPGNQVLAAALSQEPGLVEYAMERRVAISTPHPSSPSPGQQPMGGNITALPGTPRRSRPSTEERP